MRVSETPEAIFQRLVEAKGGRAGISVGRMFGSPVLKVEGKVFAMLVKGRLVVKLPGAQVEKLVTSRLGEAFDPGHGKPSKEWVAVDANVSRRWGRLVDEAQDFVGRGPTPRPKSAAPTVPKSSTAIAESRL